MRIAAGRTTGWAGTTNGAGRATPSTRPRPCVQHAAVQRATRDVEHHDAVAQRGEQRVEVEVARGVARLLLVDRGHVVAAQEVRHAGQASRPGEIVEEKRWSAIIQPTSSSGGPSAAISQSSAARARVAPRQHSGPFPLRPVRVEPREAALDQRRADASARSRRRHRALRSPHRSSSGRAACLLLRGTRPRRTRRRRRPGRRPRSEGRSAWPCRRP